MSQSKNNSGPGFGAEDLRLPDELRAPLLKHLDELRAKYLKRNWGARVGWGSRPALVVIDMAKFWLDPSQQMGSGLDTVLEGTCRVLEAARGAGIPIFFTTLAYDPATPPSPQNTKLQMQIPDNHSALFEPDSRLERRPTERLLRKPYASAFKGTNFHEMLTSLGTDTLIVTGISTSHCVYATCRDAIDSFRVIVAKEAVGERCEVMHEVNLLDIDIDLGDVTPVDDVVRHLAGLRGGA